MAFKVVIVTRDEKHLHTGKFALYCKTFNSVKYRIRRVDIDPSLGSTQRCEERQSWCG